MREAVRRGWCPIDCLWENTEFKNVEYINGCDANIEKVMRAITRMNEAWRSGAYDSDGLHGERYSNFCSMEAAE